MDFAKLLDNESRGKITEPLQLFASLAKGKGRGYLRDSQAKALVAWHQSRSERHHLVELNTGAGKTTVNLLILLSYLNEYGAPVLYLCPNRQLCQQVQREAAEIGVAASGDEIDGGLPHSFLSGQAIYVTTVHKLFNGRTKFGLNEEAYTKSSAILLDDGHACIREIRNQYTITFERKHHAWERLWSLFEHDLKGQSKAVTAAVLSGTTERDGNIVRVPYWAVRQKQQQLTAILNDYFGEEEVKFKFPLVLPQLDEVDVRFSCERAELSPFTVHIERLPTFASAKHIVMSSATYGDYASLVVDGGLSAESAQTPNKPNNLWDIGERLVLLPQCIDRTIELTALRRFIVDYVRSRTINATVIVPGNYAIADWLAAGAKSAGDTSEDINRNVLELSDPTNRGVTLVVSNRYDGIDLPGDACRLLVLDGAPRGASLRDKGLVRERAQDEATRALTAQRIEQGVGRAIRSAEDYCATILMGNDLTEYVSDVNNSPLFGPVVRSQLQLGLALVGKMQNDSDVFQVLSGVIDQVVQRNPSWVQYYRQWVSKQRIEDVERADLQLAEAVVTAWRYYRGGMLSKADASLAKYTAGVIGKKQAWLLELRARLLHEDDNPRSVDLQIKARELNDRLLKPLAGHRYTKMERLPGTQASRLIGRLASRVNGNALVIAVEAVLSELNWELEATEFERALAAFFEQLELDADTPDQKYEVGPDVLVRPEGTHVVLIEAKNRSGSPRIPRRAFEQLEGQLTWYKTEYKDDRVVARLTLHRSNEVDDKTYPSADVRVITPGSLAKAVQAAKEFFVWLSQYSGVAPGEEVVARELKRLGLCLPELVELISIPIVRDR